MLVLFLLTDSKESMAQISDSTINEFVHATLYIKEAQYIKNKITIK